MTSIREQREYVIHENNNAQDQLIGVLENLSKSTNVLEINESMHGDLDFSVLQEYEMGKIQSIILRAGEITSISNLPQNLISFECPNNLLISLENLPGSLKHINISNNYVASITVSGLEDLETLIVSHNLITSLENLPISLKELRCDNNKLERLNLSGLDKLNVLHVSNNKITLIENLPERVADFKMENTPGIEFRNSTLPDLETEKDDTEYKERTNYIDALKNFFALKNDYDLKAKRMKKQAYSSAPTKKLKREAVLSVKPKCINCKRPVGTIFSNRKDNKYSAICGDSANPCNLKIQIYCGSTVNIRDILDIFREDTEDIKDKIIQQKLDTLFNYVSEAESVKLFKKELEEYNSNSKTFKELLDFYNEKFNKVDKKEIIQKKKDIIYRLIEKVHDLLDDYNSTGNMELLRIAMRIQINELYPEVRNLRMLENEIMELNHETVSNKEIYSIFKYPTELSNIDYLFGEKARVVKFDKD
jgi:hypothetical protein